MNDEVKNIINRWFSRSKTEPNMFDQFISLWISFNAFYAYDHLCSQEKEQIKIFKDTYCKDFISCVKANSELFENFRIYIQNKPYNNGFIQDLRYELSSNKQVKKIYQKLDDINEFINCVYQVRCNLFHGGKSPENGQDKELVKLAFNCLYVFLDKVYQDKRVI